MDGCQNAIVGRPHIVVRAPRIFRRNFMSAHTISIYCWHKANYCILTTGKNDDTHQQNLNTMWFPRQLYGHIQHNGISPRIKTIVLTPKKDYGRQDYANTCWVCSVNIILLTGSKLISTAGRIPSTFSYLHAIVYAHSTICSSPWVP